MQKGLAREQIRELDRKAIEEYQIPGIILMENAGRNVAEEIVKSIDHSKNDTIAVLCGKGNNGGDGYVIARHLHNRGIAVDVFIFAPIQDILHDGDAATNLRILLNMKLSVEEIVDITGVNRLIKRLGAYRILVDALFGTGLSGEVKEPFATLILGINYHRKTVVSVDIPSGLDCNSGKVLGVAVRAAKTVTFVAAKKGFYENDGPRVTGDVIVTDISIPRELMI
ncbi:MAG: NAD(P)H-hydrate epimerase [Candidatus Brocadiaceae bacterium]|nr:NAD(P)H-hydrate epimerase [Candidatus Brocadiaceae bacterium]